MPEHTEKKKATKEFKQKAVELSCSVREELDKLNKAFQAPEMPTTT
jgi:hypothetical protein